MCAGAGAAGDGGAAERAVFQSDIDFDGRIAAAVEDFAADDVDDGGHARSRCSLRGAFYRIGAVPAMWSANGRNENDGVDAHSWSCHRRHRPVRSARIVHVPGISVERPDLPVL